MANSDQVYEAAAVTEQLQRRLPGWTATDGGIQKVYKTAGWKASLMAANAIGHLAELAWHHPDLRVSWGSVTVDLTTHSAGGVTEKDFALAERIEQLLTWTPGPDEALEGTPDDPRYAYIK